MDKRGELDDQAVRVCMTKIDAFINCRQLSHDTMQKSGELRRAQESSGDVGNKNFSAELSPLLHWIDVKRLIDYLFYLRCLPGLSPVTNGVLDL
jgi:hypothetical protein